MEEVLVPIVVVPAVFFSFVAIVKTISDNNVRRRVIDKGILDENIKFLFEKKYSDYVPVSLKWGMVLIALGIAILIGQLVPYSFHEEATISAMFILGGVALILYYFIASKMAKNSQKAQS